VSEENSTSTLNASKVTSIASEQKGMTPQSGETIGPIAIGTLPIGKSVTIKYQATVNSPPLVRSVSTQGSVSGGNFATIQTDDPEPGGANDSTVTNLDTTITWTALPAPTGTLPATGI